MFPGHPWEGEEFGPVEYEWYLARRYVFNVEFDVNMRPFINFCKSRKISPQQLTMKATTRLSAEFLPQRTIALNWKSYPARYPAGYVRSVRPGSEMLEHIAVREKETHFSERSIRDQMQPLARWMARHFPKVSIFLAKTVFASRDVKDNYALMVSRNPLRNLGTKVVFHGTHYRTFVLTIPFGDQVTCTFGAPHALGNINYFEPFLKKFKLWMEDPEQIPQELIDKAYKDYPQKES